MGRIQSSVGLVTGIDIEKTVNQLLAVQAQPRNNLEARKKGLDARAGAVTDLMALTLGAQFAARRLNSAALFTVKSANSSNTTLLTASAKAAATPGSYQFVAVRKAQTHQVLSNGVAAKDQALGAGELTFRYGGYANEGINLGELNGGAGVARGKIKITDRNGSASVVDLRYALTTDDVLNAINQDEAIDVTAKMVGDRLVLTDTSGGSANLRVDEVSGGQTAAGLGLSGISVASNTATGQDVLRLYNAMDLAKLNDGNGVKLNDALPDLNVALRDGTSLEIDFHRLASAAVKSSGDTTATNGVNAQLKFTAVQGGDDYNGVTVQFVDSGNVTSGAEVAWDANAKTLTFDIDAGTTTATDVLGALNSDPVASLVFTAANATGGDGSGLVDLTDTGLTAGGIDAIAAGTEKTLGDLINTINATSPSKLQAALSADGDRIVLTDLTVDNGGTFAVTSLNGTDLADGLGLSGAATGGTLNGKRLLGGLKTTLLSSLGGGQGLGTLGELDLTDRSGATATVNLATAETLDDVIAAIKGAGLGITADYNAARNGIQLSDTTGLTTSPLVVANGDGTNTADKLGIAASVSTTVVKGSTLKKQVVSEQTLLSSYLAGQGVKLGSFKVTDSAGLSTTVNLSTLEAKSVGDVIDAINATSVGVEAKLNDAGDGISLVDTAGGTGKLRVEDLGSGQSAADLRIKGESTTQTINATPTEVIDGSTTFKVSLDADDTLTDLVTKINALGVGASASIMAQTAGSTTHHLSLLSKKEGKPGALQIDGSGLGLSFDAIALAQDGLLQFGNGSTAGTLLSSTNNFYADALPGIDITVAQASTDPITVTVGASSTSISNAIQTFVDNYNKLRDKITTYTAFDAATGTKGVLFGSSETLRLESELSRVITGSHLGVGDFKTFAEFGVSVDDKGKLAFDNTKLAARFADDPESVTEFFTKETAGFSAKIDAAFERLVGAGNSALLNRLDSLNRQVETMVGKLADFDKRLKTGRERLLMQFYNLELVIGKIQANLTSIGSISYIAPVGRQQ
jgi:flagellar capping protein FliD